MLIFPSNPLFPKGSMWGLPSLKPILEGLFTALPTAKLCAPSLTGTELWRVNCQEYCHPWDRLIRAEPPTSRL